MLVIVRLYKEINMFGIRIFAIIYIFIMMIYPSQNLKDVGFNPNHLTRDEILGISTIYGQIAWLFVIAWIIAPVISKIYYSIQSNICNRKANIHLQNIKDTYKI